jgi:MerR family transcriptional regulator, thiopeptide resistance regulator
MGDDEYPVGTVARLAGISVRSLHHYDQVGLLTPSVRSASGRRIYSPADLGRLRQILFYRALGLALGDIAEILADPGQDAHAHLRRQHRLLREQISRRQEMLAAIERELEATTMGIALTPEEQFEIFGTDKVSGEWADEARERWGETEAWSQSGRRAAAYGKQDWLEIRAEADAISREYAAAMSAGVPAGDARVMDLAERHRQHIGRWFYDCGHEMHRGLAEMYLSDGRFAAAYEALAPGLARYVHDAMLANSGRAAH